MNLRRLLAATIGATVLLVGLPSGRALAATPIDIDGEFSDWSGKAHLVDPMRDTKHHWDDVRYWYWATNDGESTIFFMVERFPRHYGDSAPDEQCEQEIDVNWPFFPGLGIYQGSPLSRPEVQRLLKELEDSQGGFFDDDDDVDCIKDKKEVHYTIFIDTNNNGQFENSGDAVVFADYYPKYGGFTLVTVFVRSGAVWFWETGYGGFWGEDQFGGGLRCEFPVPFSAISIEPGQSLRLILFAQDKRRDCYYPDPIGDYERLVRRREADRVPDVGDLQWSPVSTLGRFGWLALLAAGAVMPVVAKRRRPASGGHDS